MPSRRVWPIFTWKGIRKQVAFELCLQEKKKKICQSEGRLIIASVISVYLPLQAKGGLRESGWGQSTGKRDQLVSTGGSRWYRYLWIYRNLSVTPNLASFPEGIMRQHCNFPKEESCEKGNIWEIWKTAERKRGQMILFLREKYERFGNKDIKVKTV